MNARTCFLVFLSFMAVNIQTTEQQECLTTLDLIILTDGSNSVGLPNFKQLQASLVNLIRRLSISFDDIHCGLVLYSGRINKVLELTGDKEAFIVGINALEYPDEETMTDLAIIEAIRMFNTGGRNGSVPKLAIIITDGQSSKPESTLAAATAAKQQNITIMAVGVTEKSDAVELSKIASSPEQVFMTKDFTTLEVSLNNATNRACVDLQSTSPTVPPTVSECQDAMIDIAFVLDISSNISANSFAEMRNFVHDFLFFADIDSGKIRVAIITYNDVAKVQFSLNTFSTRAEMNVATYSLQSSPGGGKNIEGALQTARTDVFTPINGDRPDVPNVLILLSGDDVNVNGSKAVAEADDTRGVGIHIYGIGIGHQNGDLINDIVSRPQANNSFMINSFSDLRLLISQVYDKFNRFCETPPPVPACFMGQTDLWFVVDVSKNSENLSRVQSTGDFQELKKGLTKMFDIIQDPSVANPGVRLGVITYSDTSRISADLSLPNSVNSSILAVQQIPGGISQGGANLVSALGNIVTPPVLSSYRSYVAIVAPESSYTSNLASVEEQLTRLKGLKYTIVIFIVRENGVLDQQRLQMAASGSTFFYYISRYTDLEAASKNFTRDRLCNGRLNNSSSAGLCSPSGGHREGGVGVVEHPTDCDKYIQCYYNERDNLDLGIVRQCPMGLHWNSNNMTCTSPSLANCTSDRCREGCATYKMEGACGGYWDCEDGVSVPRCCQQNYSFVPDVGCQLDHTCVSQCDFDKRCGKCQKKPNWEEPAGYDVKILGGNMWLPRPCFYEDFDIVDCDCTAPRDQVCPADRVFDFTDNKTMKDINEGVREGIRASSVGTKKDGLLLGQKSAVHVSVDKSKRENRPFTLEFRFRETETFSPYGETLVSSGLNCGTGNTLLISANDQFIFAEVRSPGGQVAEVKVPIKGLNPDDFKDLVLGYNDGVLALSIKDEQMQYIAKTSAPSNICFSCGLDIGQALNKLSFDGEVQKIAVYSCAWSLLY